jgi:glycosyltransferase involved in cell wall biosynthesis
LSRAPNKVNLLIVVAGLNIGGAEVVIQHLAEAIDRNRFNLTICCLRVLGSIGEALAADGIDIVALADPCNPKHGYLTFLKLLKLIRTKRIDVVHTHTTDALFDAALCRVLMPRIRLVHTFHFGNYPHRSNADLWLERIGLQFANRLVAVGDVQRRQIIATHGVKPGNIVKVWNGVAPVRVQNADEFRRRVGAVDKLLVGVTATLIEQKGLFDFLAVASRFRDQAERVRFVIVGEGGLRQRLEAKRRELDLEATVVFTGWIRDANRVALPAFDIFFQPSLWEAMSIALLEAMAAAKPVLVTRVGEAPHIVDDGVDALLVEPRDVDAMAMGLRRLIDEPGLRRRLGDAAIAKVVAMYTVERMTQSYEAIYEQMLQGRPSIL